MYKKILHKFIYENVADMHIMLPKKNFQSSLSRFPKCNPSVFKCRQSFRIEKTHTTIEAYQRERKSEVHRTITAKRGR